MNKANFKYFILSLITILLGAITVIVMSVLLSGMTTSKNKVDEDIVGRTIEVVSSDSDKDRIISLCESGLYSLSDYVIRNLTSSTYLINDISDERFASDLSYIIYGNENENKDEILEELGNYSRMHVINMFLMEESEDFKASSTPTMVGDSFSDVVITSPLSLESGYTIGIRMVRGSFVSTGNDVRTDFIVDGALSQGSIVIHPEINNTSTFHLSWDSTGTPSGEHDVYVLLRSSDGRGKVIEGGTILVPEMEVIDSSKVYDSGIKAGKEDQWYVLDAGIDHAYINFLELSDDIKVSLYDIYGELIGTNDSPLSKYEVLRGKAQSIEELVEDTGIMDVKNTFYAHVERGKTIESENEITYTIVTSKNVASYNGELKAVIEAEGDEYVYPLSETTIGTRDVGRNITLVGKDDSLIEEITTNVRFHPVGGFLTSFSVRDASVGGGIGVFPEFSATINNYGFYMEDGNLDVAINAISQEGYASLVNISIISSSGESHLSQGEIVSLPRGESLIKASVLSFEGETREYTIFVLNGDDEGNFMENTISLFPSSYGSGLWLLHSLHPDYVFERYDTGLDFATVLDNEDSADRSLANTYSHPLWVVPSSPVYDGGGWMQARNEVVNYFLDPRNFLDPVHVFQFERLSFDSNYHTIEGVRAIISGSFMDVDDYDYAQGIYNAGREAGVSPYFLASKIIQEMGYSGESHLCHGTLPGYEGYYNFYNIGSTPDPDIENGALINGARYAMWGRNPDEEEITSEEAELHLPWNNIDDALRGGALWIASRYVSSGQDTLYFQKFDVINNDDGLYEHQYAQNISMAYSEAARYYDSYSAINMLDQTFVFSIPVYSNLPGYYGIMPEGGA